MCIYSFRFAKPDIILRTREMIRVEYRRLQVLHGAVLEDFRRCIEYERSTQVGKQHFNTFMLRLRAADAQRKMGLTFSQGRQLLVDWLRSERNLYEKVYD